MGVFPDLGPFPDLRVFPDLVVGIAGGDDVRDVVVFAVGDAVGVRMGYLVGLLVGYSVGDYIDRSRKMDTIQNISMRQNKIHSMLDIPNEIHSSIADSYTKNNLQG